MYDTAEDFSETLSPKEKRQAYLDIYKRLRERSVQYFTPWRTATTGWYDIWRGYWEGDNYHGMSNMHIGLVYAIIASDSAQLARIVWGDGGAPQFIPTGPEDQASARRAERYIDIRMHRAGLFQTLERLNLQAQVYGVMHGRVGWKLRYGPVVRGVGVDHGRHMKLRDPRRVPNNITFDGPDLYPLGPLDGIPSPGFSNIQEMPAFFHDWYCEFEDIEIGASREPMGNAPIYDADVVKEMRASQPSHAVKQDMIDRKSLEGSGDVTWGKLGMYRAPVKMTDAFIRVPRELGRWYDPRSGVVSDQEIAGGVFMTDFIMTIADERWVLRAVPFPDGNGNKPILKHSLSEDPDHYYPPGKAELLVKMNIAINRLTDYQLDAMERWIDPPWAINVNSGIDRSTLVSGPGMIVESEGPIDDSNLRQFQPNINWVNSAFSHVGSLFQWAQRVTGSIDDVSFGFAGKSHESATSFAGRAEAVSARLAHEAARFEQCFFEPMAEAWWNLARRYATTPQLLRDIGAHLVYDPVTERFQPPDLDVLLDSDLERDFNVRARGSSKAMSTLARQNAALSLTQVLYSTGLAQGINHRAYLRQLLPIFTFTNVDELLATEQQLLLTMLAGLQQGGAGAGGNGGSNGGSKRPGSQARASGGGAGDPAAIMQNLSHFMQGGGGLEALGLTPGSIPAPV